MFPVTTNAVVTLSVPDGTALCDLSAPFRRRVAAARTLTSHQDDCSMYHTCDSHICLMSFFEGCHPSKNRRVPPFVFVKTSTSPLLPTDDSFMSPQHYSLHLLNVHFFLMLPLPLALSIDLHWHLSSFFRCEGKVLYFSIEACYSYADAIFLLLRTWCIVLGTKHCCSASIAYGSYSVERK